MIILWWILSQFVNIYIHIYCNSVLPLPKTRPNLHSFCMQQFYLRVDVEEKLFQNMI